MPVTFEIPPDSPIAVVTFAGLFTIEDTDAALAAFRAQGGIERRCIFEFDRPMANFRVENIRRVSDDMMKAGAGKPSAFVGTTDLSVEICEMIVRMIARPESVRVFRSRGEAEAWLRSKS